MPKKPKSNQNSTKATLLTPHDECKSVNIPDEAFVDANHLMSFLEDTFGLAGMEIVYAFSTEGVEMDFKNPKERRQFKKAFNSLFKKFNLAVGVNEVPPFRITHQQINDLHEALIFATLDSFY